jgi:hypothetical protein
MANVAISKNLFAESLRLIAKVAACGGRVNRVDGSRVTRIQN